MSYPERQKLVAPVPQGRVLLHCCCCCAPCAGDVIETLLWSEIDHEVLFYNPNIHPHGEYLRRKDELQRFMEEVAPHFDGAHIELRAAA